MTLAIDVAQVESVLLPDGKWHQVSDFNLDAYEFKEAENFIVKGGQVDGVPSTGARWTEHGRLVFCQLTAILAVRYASKAQAAPIVSSGGKSKKF